jgi:hypothetical protein
VWLDLDAAGRYYSVALLPKKGPFTRKEAGIRAGEFQNELLNNVLRYAIATRNQKIRESIVTEALFFSQPNTEQMKACRSLAKSEQNNLS